MARRKRSKAKVNRSALWRGSRQGMSSVTLALIALVGIAAIVGGYLLQRGDWLRTDVADAASGLQLSEIMADNASTIVTERGDVPDWIEVRNAGNSAVELKG